MLGVAADAGVLALTGATAAAEATPAERADALEAALLLYSQRRFDFDSWRPGSGPAALLGIETGNCDEYAEQVAATDAEVERLSAVFAAVLAAPALANLSEPADCPVCGTEHALTPARIAALRERVEATAGFRRAQRSAREELTAYRAALQAARAATLALSPPAAQFTEEQVNDAAAAASAVTGGPTDLTSTAQLAAAMSAQQEAAVESLDAAVAAITAALRTIDGGATVATEDLASVCATAASATLVLGEARTAFVKAVGAVLGPVRVALDEQQGTSGWSALLRLARDPDGLAADLRARTAVAVVRAEYGAAKRQIDGANLDVFNAKFADMSEEIGRWWALLRPDEPVQFKRAVPRGTGRRAVALEAALLVEGGEDLVRDALGVFSDSQLNALGLAAFLARAAMQQTGFIVLDDPVQSGDDAHRDTFIEYVVPGLLAAGLQVIVLTFGYNLNRVLTLAQPLDGYRVSLDDPTAGSVVVKGTHTAAALLDDAKGFIKEGQALRATGANRLRVAAEATAKEILVAKRTAKGERASLADYTTGRWSLEKLVPKLKEHLEDDADRRWWDRISPVLSPGAHDDVPPEKNALNIVHSGLKNALSKHL